MRPRASGRACLLPFARWQPTRMRGGRDLNGPRAFDPSAIRVYIPYAGHGPLSEIAAAGTLSYALRASIITRIGGLPLSHGS